MTNELIKKYREGKKPTPHEKALSSLKLDPICTGYGLWTDTSQEHTPENTKQKESTPGDPPSYPKSKLWEDHTLEGHGCTKISSKGGSTLWIWKSKE